jgi:hypothetical protein
MADKDDDRQMTLPWGQPSVDGSPDATRAEYERSADRERTVVNALNLSAEGYAAFLHFRDQSVSSALHDDLATKMRDEAQAIINRMGEWPLPESLDRDQDGDTLFLPYFAHYIWILLGCLAAEVLPNASHAERYAWAASFVRSWAAFGVYQSARNAGLNNDQISDLPASSAVTNPLPMGVIAHLHQEREACRREARERGVTVAEVARERMGAISERLRDQGVAVVTDDDARRGEPDDDIAF